MNTGRGESRGQYFFGQIWEVYSKRCINGLYMKGKQFKLLKITNERQLYENHKRTSSNDYNIDVGSNSVHIWRAQR